MFLVFDNAYYGNILFKKMCQYACEQQQTNII